jgi:hypothetical protein
MAAIVAFYFIPISFLLGAALVISLQLYFSHRGRAETQQTIRAALEHGQTLTPEVLKEIGDASRSPHADLRRGVIAIAIGLGIMAIGAFGIDLSEEELVSQGTLVGIGILPLLIGVAYLALWRFSPRS